MHRMRKKESPEVVEAKARAWCAYQERSQKETRKKLISAGVEREQADAIIAELISANFLNEERFAIAFAGGKFRIKHWGKNKIRAELRMHDIPEVLVNKALGGISSEDYIAALRHQLEKKLKTMAGEEPRKQFHSTLSYLVAKGFESDLAVAELNTILKNTEHES